MRVSPSNRFITVILLCLLSPITVACVGAPLGVALEPLDAERQMIFHNGVVITMNPAEPVVAALALRGEKIEAVGSNEAILALQTPATTVIDLDGRPLMPGFVDAHTHILNDHLSQQMSLDAAQTEALRNGITSLGTLYTSPQFLDEMQAFARNDYLRVRTNLYLVATDPCGNKEGNWWRRRLVTPQPDEMLHVSGVKIFSDGGSCGAPALSFELEPGVGTGDLWYSDDALREMIDAVDDAGYQVAVHAIGDRAVTQALDAFAAVLEGRPNTLRHRMEHVSVIPTEQIARFGELGIIPIIIGQYPSCTPYGPPLPTAYGDMEWPWRLLREQNPDLPIGWHSDVPFQSGNPFVHLRGFVTRIDRIQGTDCRTQPWLMDDTISVEAALSIMTRESAYALGREQEVGSLLPGMYADLIVLQNNPLTAAGADVGSNRVLLTIVGGRTAYCFPSAVELCPGFANRVPISLADLRPPVWLGWLALVAQTAVVTLALAGSRRYTASARKLGALAAIGAGLLWLLLALREEWDDSFNNAVFSVAPLLMAFGVIAITTLRPRRLLARAGLWLAGVAATLFAAAGVLSQWQFGDIGWLLFLCGLLGHTIGLTLFGAANLRERLFTRWNGVPLLTGLLGGPIPFVISSLTNDSSDAAFTLLLLSLSTGWTLIGVMLLQAARQPPPVAQPNL